MLSNFRILYKNYK